MLFVLSDELEKEVENVAGTDDFLVEKTGIQIDRITYLHRRRYPWSRLTST